MSLDVQRLPIRQYSDHSRDWRDHLYVYPVISRRSGGLSIGINLNPDAACNFDCVYCQVDRSVAPRVREVDVDRMGEELRRLIELARTEALYDDPAMRDVPADRRRIKDIAFSGDGEPTTCPQFLAAVERVIDIKRQTGLSRPHAGPADDGVKIVLITDACYLTRPRVADGLARMAENNGEIWAKLDAGTEEYYRQVNRPNYPLSHVMDNIIATAKAWPVVIQALFMRLHGEGPGAVEIAAFTDRLNDVLAGGGEIRYVQVYTVARRPAEAHVTALSDAEVDEIVEAVRRDTGLSAEPFYGGAGD